MTHSEFLERAQEISDAAVTVSVPDGNALPTEPEDRAALEAEMADLRKQYDRMERECSIGDRLPEDVERQHREAMQQVHYRIERLKHRTDFLRWQERQQGGQVAAVRREPVPEEQAALAARVERLETLMDNVLRTLDKLGFKEVGR